MHHLHSNLVRAITRSCLFGMAGAIAWIPSSATAHHRDIPYPPNISTMDRSPASALIPQIPAEDVATLIQVQKTYSSAPPEKISTSGNFYYMRQSVSYTLKAALARVPLVASGEETTGLSFLQVLKVHEGKEQTFDLPNEILSQIEHPVLSRIDAQIFSYAVDESFRRFVFTIPYAEESWRAACIKVSEGKHYNPYKEMIITLHENGKFEYEIETPALCHDALLGTGKFERTEE